MSLKCVSKFSQVPSRQLALLLTARCVHEVCLLQSGREIEVVSASSRPAHSPINSMPEFIALRLPNADAETVWTKLKVELRKGPLSMANPTGNLGT